ncbi:UvrD-helicase domain-containing protein [Sebaldella termitidis]|uniref:UvrD-helicase domain-containing protein n=1 Tax=Sebaldella termitidis TaxID=826 RepID=UPI003EC0E1F4
MKLSPTQEKIINKKGNLVVQASAGTGKTFTLVQKLKKEIEENKTHRIIAAITFTIKAAHEIKNRVSIDVEEHFIGTNNSFVVEEVIKPFMKDVFREGSITDDLDTDYSIKVKNFNEGIEKIKIEKTICSYVNSKQNFVFELANYIVRNSEVCRLYLKSKYFKIYIDEYQDCDKEMHDFFMYLCDELEIETFIVGDKKQSIYIWRGAYPQAFESIKNKNNFSSEFMGDNFRSCYQIQNYSNLLCEETRNLYQPIDESDNIILLVCTNTNWHERVIPFLKKDGTSALLRFKNEKAEQGAKHLEEYGHNFTYIKTSPVSKIATNASWFYLGIAKYVILKHYSEYDFLSEIPAENSEKNKKIIKRLRNDLIKIKDNKSDNFFLNETVVDLANYLNCNVKMKHIKDLYNTINEESYYPSFEIEKYSHIATTFHSSKGLEFDQVLLFAEDYPLYNEDSIYNHYVASTRAKHELIIIYMEETSKSYYNNLSNIFSMKGLSLENLMKVT